MPILISVGSAEVHAAPPGKGKDPGLVDCAAGDTIADALNAGVADITIRGLCDENIEITTSNVTITGETLAAGAPIDGINATDSSTAAIRVVGAQNVILRNLKVSGGTQAVVLFGGAAGTIENGDLTPDPAPTGGGGNFSLAVTDSSWARVVDSQLNAKNVFASRVSMVRLFNTDISLLDKSQPAIVALEGSHYFIAGSTLGGYVSVSRNAGISVVEEFIGVNYGTTVIDTTAPYKFYCSAYSSLSQFPNGTLVDGAVAPNALDAGDISGSFCTWINFSAP